MQPPLGPKLISIRCDGEGDPPQFREPPDLSEHAVYSHYKFGTDPRVIDIGIQPRWTPTNIIVETMRRDETLARALAARGLEVRFHGFLKGADVRLVPLEVNEMPGALDRGTIDAFAAWEPTPAIAVRAYKHQTVIHRSLCSGYLYFAHELAERRPEVVRLLVAAQLRAMSRLTHNTENLFRASGWAQQASREVLGSPIELSAWDYVELAKSGLLGITSVPLIPEVDLADGGRLNREFEFLREIKRLPEESSWEQVRSRFDRSIIPAIISAASDYELFSGEFRVGRMESP